MRAAWPLLALAMLAGCLQGEERFFPDESARVVAIRVNAYATPPDGPGPREARVEVSGLGADAEELAFSGRIRFTLEAQDASRPEHTYAAVRSWEADVTAKDFASPTVPVHAQRIDPDGLETNRTYRVHAAATIGGRTLQSEPALFYWP